MKRYLLLLLTVPLLGMLGLVAAVEFFHDQLPAPHLSSSVAFNEKAKWIRDRAHEKCDTLVVGSSMAFNNLKAGELPESVFGRRVLNLASWGMFVRDSQQMIDMIAPLCEPDSIVLLTNFTDFGTTDIKQIDWRLFGDYLNASDPLLPYLENFDLDYFLSARKSLGDSRKNGDRAYSSMEFDATGTVNLACEGFQVSPRRWEGYKYQPHFTPEAEEINLAALNAIAVSARRHHRRLVVLVSPLRQVAEQGYIPEDRERLWRETRRIVEAQDGTFIHIRGAAEFGDGLFADYAHLNACGAEKFTRQAMQELQKHLAGEASPKP